jgi:4-hydroxybenzoyl-CoA reductase subunit beta
METMPAFELVRPTSVAAAVAARAASRSARFLAGGTDLIANMRRGLSPAETLVDLSGIDELGRIEVDPDGVRIGATVTLAAVAAHPQLRVRHPALVEAAQSVAGPAHRAAGTVGGNLCLEPRCRYFNQSESWRRANGYCMKIGGDICRVAPRSEHCYAAYSGDLAPALIVLGAVAQVAGLAGPRELPLADLYADDGMTGLLLGPDEMLVGVRVPQTPGLRSGYEKLRVRQAMEFALAGMAAALRVDDGRIVDLRLATTGTDSRPLAISGLEGAWTHSPQDDTRLAKLLRKQTSPMETTLMTAVYRRRVLPVIARRLLRRLSGIE